MMDKPGTRSYIYCTPEAKKIAKLEVRVERLEMELKAEEEVGRRKIAELEAENKILTDSIKAGGEVSKRGVKRIAKLEAEIKAMELKLRAALRECDHCGALMPPATTLRGERL